MRKEADAAPIMERFPDGRVVPLLLDVTDEEGVKAAAREVERVLGERGIKLVRVCVWVCVYNSLRAGGIRGSARLPRACVATHSVQTD